METNERQRVSRTAVIAAIVVSLAANGYASLGLLVSCHETTDPAESETVCDSVGIIAFVVLAISVALPLWAKERPRARAEFPLVLFALLGMAGVVLGLATSV